MQFNGVAAAVLDALPDATAVLDESSTIIAVNRVWRMFSIDNGGKPEATGVGVSYADVCARSAEAGDDDARVVLAGLEAVLAGQIIESEHEYPCHSPTAVRWFISRITSIGAPVGGAVASHVNITRRKASELELAHVASHDPLTGAANRVLFLKTLAAGLRPRAGRPEAPDVGVFFIDLDKFKHINDTYGHDAGDELLLATTHRLSSQVRPGDLVARLGGDEFAIYSPRTSAAGVDSLSRRVTSALAEPHLMHGQQIRVTGSVGAYLASAGESPADALDQADQAMYAVKRARYGDIDQVT